jgi:AraC family transcriptional regulator, regulatory protein of adaptative response / methylated-DNA-[protein]-cysteine methyltransferase
MSRTPSQKEMDNAVRNRDESYDGIFFIAVKTTGIFCRPSCPSRPALPRNRKFFGSTREAIFAGYRPCKRCRPMAVNGAPPQWAKRLFDAVEKNPSHRLRDADLRRMAIDPARARRYFLKHHGMTFQAYCRGRRMTQAFQQIRRGAELDEVVLNNGYDSHSGFRDAFVRTFGDAPGRSRSADCVVVSWLESPVGPLIIGATDKGVCLVEFTDRRALETQLATLRKRFTCAIVPGEHKYLTQLKQELTGYFAGKRTRFEVPLIYPGTPFQNKVWNGLLQIPYGETISYEELARRVGAPGAQRAVGHANGQNRIAIVIPCHRVVNKGGKLGGYGGGLWRKQHLLDLERGISEGSDGARPRSQYSPTLF